MGGSKIFTVYIQGLQKYLLLIRLIDMGFNGMFSDPHCRYIGLTVGSVLIRFIDMGYNRMIYTEYILGLQKYGTCF